MVDTYQTTTTKTAKVEVVKLKSFVRLVIYGGAKKASDNSAFKFASKNVVADYKNDLFPGLPMWSLRLVGTSSETYLGANSHTGIVKVNSAVEETKIVISRKKFDPKAVYIINNKRYVCKKIEMTVTATGPAPTQRFILYELLE